MSTDIESLYKSLTSKSFNNKELLKYKLDKKGQKVVFQLIRYYQLKHSQSTKDVFDLPYKSSWVDTENKKGIKIDLDSLPNNLKETLLKFCVGYSKGKN